MKYLMPKAVSWKNDPDPFQDLQVFTVKMRREASILKACGADGGVEKYDEALHPDLFDASLYLEFSQDPHRLEVIIGDRLKGAGIVLDEIQKTPALLDEVHRLMESRRWRLALLFLRPVNFAWAGPTALWDRLIWAWPVRNPKTL